MCILDKSQNEKNLGEVDIVVLALFIIFFFIFHANLFIGYQYIAI
jgi:hypothetical protein